MFIFTSSWKQEKEKELIFNDFYKISSRQCKILTGITIFRLVSKYSRKDTACFYLISDVSTSNTTATNSGLTFNIAANETYRIMIAGTCSKATTTTGMKIAIGAPTGCSLKSVIQGGQALMVTAPQGQLLSAVNTLCTSPFANGAGVEVPFRLEGVITNGANAGSITLQFATVTSNAATIYSGTVMQLIKSKGL